MSNHSNKISFRRASILSGIALLLMVINAPIAELYILPIIKGTKLKELD